jgi:hypothetical protein
MALRKAVYGGKLAITDVLVPNKMITLNMNRQPEYKNLSYDFTFTVDHNNSATITTDAYLFLKNFLLNIKFNTGAGDNLFDLSALEISIIQLMENGKLRYSIDKTNGNNKISTIMVRWNFTLPKNFQNPMDTVFHSDSDRYNYVQVKMTPQTLFNQITNLTVNSVSVKVKEVFKHNPTPKEVRTIENGQVVSRIVPPSNKIIKIKDHGFNSSTNAQTIELPKDTAILGFYAYVVDENDKLKVGGINNISVKSGNTYFIDGTFDEFNDENKDTLKDETNVLADNFCFVDLCDGQFGEALLTGAPEHRNTILSFDLTATAGSNNLRILYLTIAEA